MELIKAELSDLAQLKSVFTEITKEMARACNGRIWNDYYPNELFEEDIENKALYILKDGEVIVSAFALYDSNEGEKYVEWSSDNKAFYIDRFGVNVNYQHKGIAGLMLKNAAKIAENKGAEYLRLFVVVRNFPAIALYEKNGFKRVKGEYKEDIGYEVLTEYGYEIKLK